MQRAMVREREVEFHQALNKRRDREVFMVSNFGQSVNYRKCFKPSPSPGRGGEWPGGELRIVCYMFTMLFHAFIYLALVPPTKATQASMSHSET